MSGEVINPQSFKDRLTEKIKNDFAELIPEEDWDKLVETVTTEFIEKEVPELIRAELSKQVSESFKSWVNLNCNQWNNANEDAFKKIIMDCAPALMAGMFQNMANDIAYSITNSMRNGY